MKRLKWMMLLTVILAFSGCQKESDAPVNEVVLEEPKEEVLEVYGVVETDKIREVSIDFPAKVEEIHIREGEIVEEGSPLLTLDINDYKDEIIKKEKELNQLKVKYDSIGKDSDVAVVKIENIKDDIAFKEKTLAEGTNLDVVELKNQIEFIKEDIKEIENEQAMKEELLSIGAVAESELKEDEKAIKEKQNNIINLENKIEKIIFDEKQEVKNLKVELEIYKIGIDNKVIVESTDKDVLGMQIEVAELEIAKMKSKLNESNLKENELISEYSKSIVQSLDVHIGEEIGTNNMVCTLASIDDLVAVVDVPQIFIEEIKQGDKASIGASGNKEECIEGKVLYISQYAVKKNGENMVKVTLELPEKQEILKLGYEVDVSFNLNKK